MRGTNQWAVNSAHKGPVMREVFSLHRHGIHHVRIICIWYVYTDYTKAFSTLWITTKKKKTYHLPQSPKNPLLSLPSWQTSLSTNNKKNKKQQDIKHLRIHMIVPGCHEIIQVDRHHYWLYQQSRLLLGASCMASWLNQQPHFCKVHIEE